MQRRSELHVLHQSVWRLREARRSRVPGPIAKLFAAIDTLGWAWVEPFVLRLQDGRELHILQTSRSLWDHEVREALRRALWRRAAARRHDMEGLEVGLDVHATMALYQRKSTSEYERGVLRSVFAGAVCTRATLHKAGVVDSPLCAYCKREVEDTDHMWWRCSEWQHCRDKHWDVLFAFRAHWPACF